MTQPPFRILYVGMGRYAPNEEFGNVLFPHFDLFTVWEGSVLLHAGGVEHKLVSGDGFVIRAGRRFHGVAGPHGARLWVMHFSAWPDGGRATKVPSRVIAGVLGGDLERMAAERLFELHAGGMTKRIPETEALGRYLLGHAHWRAANPFVGGGRRDRFEALLSRAKSGLGEGVAVAALAEAAGLSPGYFRVCFRREFGKSPAAAVRDLRMAEARRMLAETRVPVKQIAAELGYSEVSAFHRAFHRSSGKTPADYRDSCVRAV